MIINDYYYYIYIIPIIHILIIINLLLTTYSNSETGRSFGKFDDEDTTARYYRF